MGNSSSGIIEKCSSSKNKFWICLGHFNLLAGSVGLITMFGKWIKDLFLPTAPPSKPDKSSDLNMNQNGFLNLAQNNIGGSNTTTNNDHSGSTENRTFNPVQTYNTELKFPKSDTDATAEFNKGVMVTLGAVAVFCFVIVVMIVLWMNITRKRPGCISIGADIHGRGPKESVERRRREREDRQLVEQDVELGELPIRYQPQQRQRSIRQYPGQGQRQVEFDVPQVHGQVRSDVPPPYTGPPSKEFQIPVTPRGPRRNSTQHTMRPSDFGADLHPLYM